MSKKKWKKRYRDLEEQFCIYRRDYGCRASKVRYNKLEFPTQGLIEGEVPISSPTMQHTVEELIFRERKYRLVDE